MEIERGLVKIFIEGVRDSVLKESLQINPKTIMDLDLQASNLAAKVTPQESPNVLWGRLIFAWLFLVVVLLCGIWTAQNGLEEWRLKNREIHR